MKITALLFLITYFTTVSYGQDSKENRLTIGIEQDILPYIFKGYFLSGWIGQEDFRYRLSYAESTIPKFILGEDIASDRVYAFGISYEYFVKENFQGLWFGPGFGYWRNLIKTKNNQTLTNKSIIFSLGGGYNLKITNWLYCSPWLALHTRISGNLEINTGLESYKPLLFTPEASFKIGIKFP